MSDVLASWRLRGSRLGRLDWVSASDIFFILGGDKSNLITWYRILEWPEIGQEHGSYALYSWPLFNTAC